MRERGYTVCRGKRLVRGRQAVGTEASVVVPVECPGGAKPAAIFHTHTKTIAPSAQDMASAERFNLPVCVRLGKRVRCYPPGGGRKST